MQYIIWEMFVYERTCPYIWYGVHEVIEKIQVLHVENSLFLKLIHVIDHKIFINWQIETFNMKAREISEIATRAFKSPNFTKGSAL